MSNKRLSDFSLLKSMWNDVKIKVNNNDDKKINNITQEENTKNTTKQEYQYTNNNTNRHQISEERRNNYTRHKNINTNTHFRHNKEEPVPQKESMSALPPFEITLNMRYEITREENDLFKWLCYRFNTCFSRFNKKPLKIGISDDIKEFFEYENCFPIDEDALHAVLRRYVGDKKYQESILKYRQRFNIFGVVVAELNTEHIEHATLRLKTLHERYNESKENDTF